MQGLQLPAINPLRSKSEHSAHRTPRKDKDKNKPNTSVEPSKLPPIDSSRVVAEAQVSRAVAVSHKSREAAPSSSNMLHEKAPNNSNYPNKVINKPVIVAADKDDDDFLEDDSLSGADMIYKAQKKLPKSSGVPQYDDGIRMEYEDDSKKIPSQGNNKYVSKIPTIIRKNPSSNINNSSSIPTEFKPDGVKPSSVQALSTYANTNSTADDISDVSSQEGKAFRNGKEQKNIGFSPNILFDKKDNKYTKPNVQPQLGMLPNMDNFNGNGSESSPASTGVNGKKKVKKVWKMAPIPIKPYIPLAAPGDRFN